MATERDTAFGAAAGAHKTYYSWTLTTLLKEMRFAETLSERVIRSLPPYSLNSGPRTCVPDGVSSVTTLACAEARFEQNGALLHWPSTKTDLCNPHVTIVDKHPSSMSPLQPWEWLPSNKKAAVCFTIDDLHPGKSTDAYEAGGDLGRGALRHLEWLLRRHPCLHATLFVTADWREINPFPTRSVLAKLPGLRNHVYLTRVLPRGTMRLGRHPDFIAYLKSLPRTDYALHGLYHVNEGSCITEEYKGKTRKECERNLREAMAIFREAELPYSPGMCPPSWGLSDDLAEAMISVGFRFVASARDIRTPITPDAVNSMSGRKGVSIFYPEKIMGDRLLHFSTNFQATSAIERAHQIVELNGLVAIKAHIVKEAFGFIQLDGLEEGYRDYLHRIFIDLEDRYGDDLWWTSMAEITARCST